MIDSFSVGEIVFGAGSPMVQNTASVISLAAQKGIAMRTVKPQQDQTLRLGESTMTVFCAPSLQIADEENNRSLLVRIDRGSSSLLLTGDLEREAEERLLKDADKAVLCLTSTCCRWRTTGQTPRVRRRSCSKACRPLR